MRAKPVHQRHVGVCIVFFALALPTLSGRTADTEDIRVRATVEGGCTITDAGELNFGVLNPSNNSPATATGAVTYWCAKGTSYNIQISNGENYDTGSGQRRMMQEGGSAVLPYSLQEPTGNPYVGNGPTPPETYQMTATVLAADIKAAPASNYRDNVVITIEP